MWGTEMGTPTIQLDEEHARLVDEFLAYRWEEFIRFLDEQTEGAGAQVASEISEALVINV